MKTLIKSGIFALPISQKMSSVSYLIYQAVHQSLIQSPDFSAHISGRLNPGFVRVYPPHLLYNRRGLTRNNSEFWRPEMWAQDKFGSRFRSGLALDRGSL
jgi:hypothetical protein